MILRLFVILLQTHLVISNCGLWAQYGECQKNPSYMFMNCKSECEAMGHKQKEYSQRCIRENNTEALPPFQLYKMFESILVNFKELEPEMVSMDPPIIVFDNFASIEETNAFVTYAQGKYVRSTGLEVKADGTYGSIETPIRTSSNTWCQSTECLHNEHIQNVTKRVSDVTNIPSKNFEYAQLLYYHSCNNENDKNCSFYKMHHDYIQNLHDKNEGPRILTCFIYLNDVEKGGFTVFETGISVQPKQGRAILWPSVKDETPQMIDPRTNHEARPVLKGEKMAANFWIHQYDFKTPHAKGC